MFLHRNAPIQRDYDVVVVGSGLAGMTAANILARQGRSVLLTEAHQKLGGFATWFTRPGGHIFDVSLHGFPHGMIKTCRKYWNTDIANDIVQLKDVRFVNPEYTLSSTFTREDFTDKLISHFGVPPETVERFFETLFNANFYDDAGLTNGELFERFFPGRSDIVRFLMEPIVYANGSTLEDPAISYAIVFSNFMRKGVYTFIGGTDGVIRKMQTELVKNGVDIKVGSKVDRILVEQGEVRGIEVNGQRVRTRAVLSNANLRRTIFDLVGESHFSPTYIAEASRVRMNSSSCQVYIGIRKGETIPYVGDLVFTSSAPRFSTEALLSKTITCRTFSFYYPSSRPKHNRSTIVASTNARWEDWAHLNDDDYAIAKQDMIDDTLRSLESFIPGIRDQIDFVEAASPRTIAHYTHHLNGSSFGTKFEGLPISMGMHKEVGGLFHAGSVGIIMSGWLGAANYGAIQTNEIERYLHAQSSPTVDP